MIRPFVGDRLVPVLAGVTRSERVRFRPGDDRDQAFANL
jgi:hypothetical protein